MLPAAAIGCTTPWLVAVTADSAKDAIIAWFRGEFAAANAIIDSLCDHLVQLTSDGTEAVHRRRMIWIPVLQIQKYYSLAEVAVELQRVTEMIRKEKKKNLEGSGEDGGDLGQEDSVIVSDASPEREITDTGSGEGIQTTSEECINLCSNHDDYVMRLSQIKMTNGFSAKEYVNRHMVNVVCGLKLYEEVLTDFELSKLKAYINKLSVAGHKGEHSGETFKLYNQQKKGNQRGVIQFGAPIFKHMNDETTDHKKGCIEPIPSLIQGIIHRLVQWKLISETRKPNSCIINFFDENEFSQPTLKPPHVEQPISTLFLSESMMAFGGSLVRDSDGNYRGSLVLSLKEGSILVMRKNSCDLARHAMCASPNNRVSITFYRVCQDTNQNTSLPPPPPMWQPNIPSSYATPNGNLNGEQVMDIIPKWELLQTPVMVSSPAQTKLLSPRINLQEGTGVFLPWNVGPSMPARRLPPRARKRQSLSISSAYQEMKAEESTTNPTIS